LIFHRLLAGIIHLGWAGHRLEGKLADAHAGVQRDGHAIDIGDFQRDRATEARIDETCGAVHDDTESPEAAATLDARDEIARQGDRLQRDAEHEVIWLHDEGLPFLLYFDAAGAVLECAGISWIEHGRFCVFVELEMTAKTNIQRARADVLQVGLVGRTDLDVARLDEGADIAVGEDHAEKLSERILDYSDTSASFVCRKSLFKIIHAPASIGRNPATCHQVGTSPRIKKAKAKVSPGVNALIELACATGIR